MKEDTNISSTEHIKYAGFRKRLLAYLVDISILVLVNLLFQNLMGQNPLAFLKTESLSQIQQSQTNNSMWPTIF